MANLLTSNPIWVDSKSSSAISGVFRVRQIQWIDDAGDIANDDDMSIVLNGVTLSGRVQVHETAASQDTKHVVLWDMGPFNPGIQADGIEVTVLDHGAVVIWLD